MSGKFMENQEKRKVVTKGKSKILYYENAAI